MTDMKYLENMNTDEIQENELDVEIFKLDVSFLLHEHYQKKIDTD